jgi:uncharacterized integral membrane protein
VKFVLGIIIGVLVVVFIFQNTQMVEVTFIAWTIRISRALMVLMVFFVGTVLGWIIGGIRHRRIENRRSERRSK